MAFTYTRTKVVNLGNGCKIAFGTWDSASVTTGDIPTGLRNILFSSITNKTGVRASTAIDDTTTAGTMTPSGLTSNDAGQWFAIGN